MDIPRERAESGYTFSARIPTPWTEFIRIVSKFPVTAMLVTSHLAIFAAVFCSNQIGLIDRDYGFSAHVLSTGSCGPAGGLEVLTRLLSYSFIHASPVHLMLNAVSLTFFGALLERNIGSSRLLAFYLLSAVGAALAHALVSHYFSLDNDTVLVGSSGTIFGILGCAAARGSRLPLYLISIEPTVSGIMYAYSGQPTGIAAHIGGFLTGFLLAKLIAYSRPNNAAIRFGRSQLQSKPIQLFQDRSVVGEPGQR